LRDSKVLVVDDNESVRPVLDNYMEDFNFRVKTVNSGEKTVNEVLNAATGIYSFLIKAC
jgi:CheY-like chemotaxis protein